LFSDIPVPYFSTFKKKPLPVFYRKLIHFWNFFQVRQKLLESLLDCIKKCQVIKTFQTKKPSD
jgi:hypothetical protein